MTWTTVDVTLCEIARKSGAVELSGLSGLTVGKPVMVMQALAAYSGKGDLTDEGEFGIVSASGVVTASDTIKIVWASDDLMIGSVKLAYAVGV